MDAECDEHVRSRAFLMECLEESGLEEDLLEAVCETSLVAGYNALDLASGVISTSEVARKLYLTGKEAEDLVNCCVKKCMVARGDEIEETEAKEPSDDEICEALSQKPEGMVHGKSSGIPASGMDMMKWPTIRNELELSRGQSSVSSHRHGIDTHSTHIYLDPPNSSSTSSPTVLHVPALKEESPIGKPFNVKKTVEDWLEKNPPEIMKEEDSGESEDSEGSNKGAYPVSASLLRKTAAFKAKVKQLEESTTTVKQWCEVATVPKTVSSRLSKPTHTNQIETKGMNGTKVIDDSDDRPRRFKQMEVLKTCEEVSQTEDRPPMKKKKKKTKDPAKFQTSCNQRQLPCDHRSAKREIKPFALRSLARHKHAVRELKNQVAYEQEAEAKAREFRARNYNRPHPPRIMSAPVKRTTIAHAPRLLSEKRAQHWANVIKPVQVYKEEMHKKFMEEKKRNEEIAMCRILKTSRQALVHHARPMPDFSKVFKPDLALAAPSTTPRSPRITKSRQHQHVRHF